MLHLPGTVKGVEERGGHVGRRSLRKYRCAIPPGEDARGDFLVEADRRRAAAAVATAANTADHDTGGDHADCRPEPPLLVDGVGLDDDGRGTHDDVRREGRAHLGQVDVGRLDQHGGRLDHDGRRDGDLGRTDDDLRGRRLHDELEALLEVTGRRLGQSFDHFGGDGRGLLGLTIRERGGGNQGQHERDDQQRTECLSHGSLLH
jgi:hypothetical protein